MDRAKGSQKRQRIQEIVGDFLLGLEAGELVSDEAIIEAHPDLKPELAEELRRLRLVHEARQKAEDESRHASCPHCHSSVEIPASPPEAGITCTFCASQLEVDDHGAKKSEADVITSIGRYRVERILGAGGFGRVYLAHDDELQRAVAIKVPHAERVKTEQDVQRYLAEARIVASLDHPGIVPAYDVGRTGDGWCFVVSKFIEGRDLRRAIGDCPPTHTESAEVVAAVAEALHHAHVHGVVHRDVKPSNILIGGAGRPYVTDFGLALHERDLGEGPVYAGSPAYMSPEQASGQSHLVDGRSDIFSLGVIFYELLTGVRPFQGDTRQQLLDRITSLEARPPRQIDDSIPRELERICLKAMAKRMTDRYTTALDMALDLRRFVGELRVLPRVAVPSRVEPEESLRAPPYLDENVQFTVYRPKAIEPAKWYPLVAFAHLAELPPDAPEGTAEPIEEVRRQAEQSLVELAGQYGDVTQDSRCSVPRESELTFLPEVPGVEFNPRSRTFVWKEIVHREEFRLHAAPACAGQVVRGRLTVFSGAILLADVSISMRVQDDARGRSDESAAAVDRACRYRRIFASYSPEDGEIVRQFEHYARALGDEYHHACTALRLSPEPNVLLEEPIRQSDVFQLFWSWNSMRSPVVRHEWEYAVSLNRQGFVRPVYWEMPLPTDEQDHLPPESLRRLGFQRIGRHAAYPPLGTGVTPSTPSLLDQTIEATPPSERSRAQELVQELTAQTLNRSLVYSKDATRTIEQAIQALDPMIPEQRELLSRLTALQEEVSAAPELEELLERTLDAASARPQRATVQKLARVRKPRCHIVYEMEEAGGVHQRELPLVIGVLGDFLGDRRARQPLKDREFQNVDRDNFDRILGQIRPELTVEVDNAMGESPTKLTVHLKFDSLDDFGPANIVRQVEPLAALLVQRQEVRRRGGEVAAPESTICRQLRAILHAPRFQRLEAAWRGLHSLVTNVETGAMLKIRVLDVSKRELLEDFAQTGEPAESELFRKVYEEQLIGTPDGEPFGVLLGDYEFSHHPDDIALLRGISHLASVAFCPFISAASPRLCGVDRWSQLSDLGDVETVPNISEDGEREWNAMRSSETARFVILTVPRALCRLPYDAGTSLAEDFGFEEIDSSEHRPSSLTPSEQHCWGNGAYILGARLADSFAKNGHCMAIWRPEAGRVAALPSDVAPSHEVDVDRARPTEMGITSQSADRFARLGLLPLAYEENADHVVSIACAPPMQRPSSGSDAGVMADAVVAARLPYVMAVSRFAHYLMLLARDKLGGCMPIEDCQVWLQRWIAPYVSADPTSGLEMKARYPLREAGIEVRPLAGEPGRYEVVASLRPWLPNEELTQSQPVTIRVPAIH